ncbi:MAG: acetyl-CoA C-acyltransferase, partial [Jatrophihabitans sp.]
MTGSVIVSGARTPMGRLLGSLKGFSGADLGGFAIKAALERAGATPAR